MNILFKSVTGLEPATLRLEVLRAIQLRHTDSMHRVGFEPTKHYASDLKSDPFDHSGIDANK